MTLDCSPGSCSDVGLEFEYGFGFSNRGKCYQDHFNSCDRGCWVNRWCVYFFSGCKYMRFQAQHSQQMAKGL